MNLSIVGFGQMGRLIRQSAISRGHRVCSVIDPFDPEADYKAFGEESMKEVEVCIVFTRPDVAMNNIQDACRWNKDIVMGTTGWVDKMPQVSELIDTSGRGMVYASNFSIGVNLFFKMVEQAAQVMDAFPLYDVLAYEAHHNKKRDSPSGTAVTLGKILLDQIDRKKRLVEDKLDRKIESEELHFASIRGGSIPGTHTVLFDSEFDSIELKHTARNRMGFANGAVMAAEWIMGKKGLYTEKEMMDHLLGLSTRD